MNRHRHLIRRRALALCQVIALLLTSFVVTPAAVQASPSSAPKAAPGVALNIVAVAAPAINCLFDNDCTITVSDSTDVFNLPGATGNGFLQSRLWPVGEAGTTGAGLYPYVYRISATEMQAVTAEACVTSMGIDFGDVVPMDYNGDSKTEDVWVTTQGGLGDVAPTAANKVGDTITFLFRKPVCPAQTSFFFGLASKNPPRDVTATLAGTLGFTATLDAKAPTLPTTDRTHCLCLQGRPGNAAGQFKAPAGKRRLQRRADPAERRARHQLHPVRPGQSSQTTPATSAVGAAPPASPPTFWAAASR